MLKTTGGKNKMINDFEKVLVRCDLEQSDKEDILKKMTSLVLKIEEIEADKKEVTARLNKQIKDKQTVLEDLAKVSNQGWIDRNVECYLVVDTRSEKVFYYRRDTGELVKTRPMEPRDVQIPLPFGNGEMAPGWNPSAALDILLNEATPWDRIPIRTLVDDGPAVDLYMDFISADFHEYWINGREYRLRYDNDEIPAFAGEII
jgi:hypothetical protein